MMRIAAILLLGGFSAISLWGQPKGFLYDEAKVPDYTLPEVLVMESGERVGNSSDWTGRRRAEVLKLFEDQVYGKVMPRLPETTFELAETSRSALGGKAIRKQITALFDGTSDGPSMSILLYLPADANKPVPVFVGLNFQGNHTIHSDPAILVTKSWQRQRGDDGRVVNNRATEKGRGTAASRWPVEYILSQGCGVATIYYGDIDPDFDDGFENGVHPLLMKHGLSESAASSIGAWAWGLSRAMDYFETDKDVNEKQVAVIGHSRLGKTSLWAGAADERFSIVISNDSGCGGAALSRRAFGETVERINTSFPHWFCDNFTKYNGAEDKLPVDQHMLIALMAPRPVYIGSAEDDLWADPHGEFLSGLNASPVYKLFGLEGMPASKQPPVNEPVMGTIGYHKRIGGHDLTTYDWEQYMRFADKHWGR